LPRDQPVASPAGFGHDDGRAGKDGDVVTLDVHDGSTRRTVMITSDLVRIGRDAECDVLLPDPTVSRVHAVLRAGGAGWQLEDAGSRNGTFVNGRRVTGSQPISPTDRIMIGNFVLVLHTGDGVVETLAAEDATAVRVQVETGLSVRELEVLRLVCAGDTDQQIAQALVISVKTVHSHLDRVRDKTGCRRRAELIRYAMDHGVA
jgi:DNA-binding CsgD family transcriptional regulator